MIHRVVDRRWRPDWTIAPLFLALLLQLAAATPARQWSERVAVQWITTEGWTGYTTHEGVLVPTPARQQHRGSSYHPGPVQDVRHVAPRQQLPRSAFGDARWSPLTDRIVGPTGQEWAPFEIPTAWYFTGTLRQITGGTQASFQSAMNAAVDGDIVELASNVTFTSAYNIPNRSTAGYVLVRGQSFAVAQGTRVVASDFSGAFAITGSISTGSVGAVPLLMAQGASGWYFRGLKLQNGLVSTSAAEGMMWWGASSQPTTAAMPTKLVMEQCWLTNPWVAATSNTIKCKRGLRADGEYMQVLETRIDGMAGNGLETQAILFGRGRGKALVRNCYLEGATENIMCGSLAGTMGALDYNADIIVRRSHLFKQVGWMNVASSIATRKNFYEIKDGFRQVVEGCELENHDGDGQQHDVVLNNKPQNPAHEAWCGCDDIWVRHSRFRASYGPVNVGAAGSDDGDNRNPGAQRVQVSNCLWQDSRCVPGHPDAGSGRFQLVGLQNVARTCPNIAIEYNTAQTGNTVLLFSGNSTTNQNSTPGLVFINNVCYLDVQYATPRSNTLTGSACLEWSCGLGLYTFAGNVAYSTRSGFSFPGTISTTNYKATTPIIFANEAGGDFTLTDSRYTNKATDGGVPGVDMVQLLAFTAGVR